MYPPTILVINAGSSSIKFSLLDPQTGSHLFAGAVERIGEPEAELCWRDRTGPQSRSLPIPDHQAGLAAAMELIAEQRGRDWQPDAVGHRVVHGGEAFKSACVIDEANLAKLDALTPLAPLHNPVNLLGIRAARELFPDLMHVAVMDTAFHQTMPQRAYLYPLPYDLYEKHGVRRYGFHGTSHRYVTEQAALRLGKPLEDTALISAHLGNGCSAAAVLGGKCVDTTMGLTPLEGLVMGTRCGDVDPALHQFLADNLGMSLAEINNLLNRASGLLGLSGLSNDMRTLSEAAGQGNQRASLAIEIFCYRLAKAIAALVVPLGRLDALIFTGGIGTYNAAVRASVVKQLGFLGLKLDAKQNNVHGQDHDGRITRNEQPAAWVIKTDEELVIAQQTWRELQATKA